MHTTFYKDPPPNQESSLWKPWAGRQTHVPVRGNLYYPGLLFMYMNGSELVNILGKLALEIRKSKR